MKVTIMTYNVERGFHTRDHNIEKKRLMAAQQAVQKVNPDILAITEACYGAENSQGILMDYQKLFDFPYGKYGGYPTFGPRKGDEGGNCILSKYPLDAENVKLLFKGAIRARIGLEGIVLTIDVVHPSYSVDDYEKIKTLNPLISNRPSHYILTVDFNTVHPDDKYNWDLLTEELTSFNPKKANQVIANWTQAGFISWLQKIGLDDSFPKSRRESTVPTNYAYGETRTGVRMDFFFHSQDIEAIDSYVLKDSNTEIASDHYPIVGIFKTK